MREEMMNVFYRLKNWLLSLFGRAASEPHEESAFQRQYREEFIAGFEARQRAYREAESAK